MRPIFGRIFMAGNSVVGLLSSFRYGQVSVVRFAFIILFYYIILAVTIHLEQIIRLFDYEIGFDSLAMVAAFTQFGFFHRKTNPELQRLLQEQARVSST